MELQQRGLIRHLGLSNVTATQVAEACGFTPLQSDSLSEVARRLGVTPMQVALAWLLARAANILLIPGASSLVHLREDLAVAPIRLDKDALAELATIGAHV